MGLHAYTHMRLTNAAIVFSTACVRGGRNGGFFAHCHGGVRRQIDSGRMLAKSINVFNVMTAPNAKLSTTVMQL